MLPLNQIKLIIAGLVIAISVYAGWTIRDWKADAELAKQLQVEIEQKAQYEELSRQLVKRYLDLQQVSRVEYRKITGRIPDVTDNRICFADSAALSVWNDSLNGVSSAAAGASSTTARTSATDREVLNNAAANFQQYKEARDQLNGIIDFYELKYKGK